jgi:DNA-binding Lrp family transcriptional regulator
MLAIDDLDLSLLRLLIEEPRAGSREYARILGVARGTAQARIARLERAGVIIAYSAHLSVAALGYPIQAFTHLHLAQGMLDEVTERLSRIPEVLEAHSTAGDADLLCKIVARDNAELERIIQSVLALPGVVRTRTEIALTERLPYRVLPLLQSRRGTARACPGAE